jgi:hypothetical protein
MIKNKEKRALMLKVMKHATSLAMKRSFLFHFFISQNRKDLKNLAMQLRKLHKLNKLIKNMNEEKLEMLEKDLFIFEEEIKKFELWFESDIKNKSDTKVQRKKVLGNKKGKEDIKNQCPFDHTTCVTPRLKSRNRLLDMATG